MGKVPSYYAFWGVRATPVWGRMDGGRGPAQDRSPRTRARGAPIGAPLDWVSLDSGSVAGDAVVPRLAARPARLEPRRPAGAEGAALAARPEREAALRP